MKKHYTLKMLLAMALLLPAFVAQAQKTEFLNANNVSAGIGTGGNLFSQIGDSIYAAALFEAPKGSGINPFYTASIWMTARDNGGNLRCAAQRYAATGHDFYEGPIVNNYTAAYDSFFSRVFKVTQAQIVRHQGLSTPVGIAQIDRAILLWPAKGNPFISSATGVNITNTLAPFVDVDNDAVYNPRNGDYPKICGDEAVFFVFNDDRGLHHETNGQKLGVEVRGLAQVYNYGNSPISNTVFVSYELENKSANDYTDFYLSMFEDPDLGCYFNDRVGCDTALNLIFTYNGTAIDPDCNGSKGYGNLSVAAGTKLLRGGFSSFGYFTNGAIASMVDPTTAAGIRNYQTAFWNDGTPFTERGDGFSGVKPTKFLFPGNPGDPLGWTDQTSGLQEGDRRMVATSLPGSFGAGEVKVFDYAFFVTQNSSATNLSIVDTLKREAASIQDFYNNNFIACLPNPFTATAINKVGSILNLVAYPNPSSSALIVEADTKIDLIEVTDLLGKTALIKAGDANKVSVDVSGLEKGLYLLKVKSANNYGQLKVVKE